MKIGDKVTYTPPPGFTGLDTSQHYTIDMGEAIITRPDEDLSLFREMLDAMNKVIAMAQETINTGGRVELHPEQVRSTLAKALGHE